MLYPFRHQKKFSKALHVMIRRTEPLLRLRASYAFSFTAIQESGGAPYLMILIVMIT